MENQGIGLAEAVGFVPEVKRVRARFPWTVLPAGLWPFPFHAAAKRSDALTPPWPDILITCGRRSVPLSLAIRQESGGKNGLQFVAPRKRRRKSWRICNTR